VILYQELRVLRCQQQRRLNLLANHFFGLSNCRLIKYMFQAGTKVLVEFGFEISAYLGISIPQDRLNISADQENSTHNGLLKDEMMFFFD
jgi:hypothetical protein